jgi:pimeloyl-ACP methyl ester carboxylesterase
MFVRHYGESGPLVLVLHGGPAAAGDVAPVAKGISGSFHAVEPWQRGSGERPLTVARHIADLHELIEQLGGHSRVAILGHSWGAMLALCYAAEHPGKAGPIVLVGCGTFDRASRSRMQATIEQRMNDDLRRRIGQLSAKGMDPAERFIQAYKLTRHIYDYEPIKPYADKEEYEPFDLAAHNETWNDICRLQDAGLYPDAFNVIESPVLMLHGAFDPHPGKMIRDSLLPYIPQLEYREYERCGHSPWVEKSAHEAFFHDVRDWLDRKSAAHFQ